MWPIVLLAALWMSVTLGMGAYATPLGPWYYGLRKPSWQPPDWLFGPAWTLIFALAAAAAIIAWRSPNPAPAARPLLVTAYLANGVLNTCWSVLFFTLRRPDWALLEVPVLWLSIFGMIAAIRPLAARAAWLLVPYVLWVSFAAVLNLAITRLNH